MDEYDRRLVEWFDSKFWPMIGEEHYVAEKRTKLGLSSDYWHGYFEALDMVYGFIDKAIEEIRSAVEGEEEEANDG